MLQKQQPAACHHGSSNLSIPPGEAEYLKGGGLMRTVQESVKRQKMHSSPVSQLLTPVTPTGLICTITVGILPPAIVLAENLMKATLKEGSPNLFKVASKCMDQQVPMGQAIEVDPRTTQHRPQGHVHQLHAPVNLALVVAQ